MKKMLIAILALAGIWGLQSSDILTESAITGKVIPPDGVVAVYAITRTDTLKATSAEGAFSISVKEGIYKIVIDAREPYKDAIIETVEAREGQNTDLGEIRLQQ